MIYPDGGALPPPLESGGVFSDIVGQSGQLRLCLCAEGTGKSFGQVGCVDQMLRNGLPPSVLCNMCKKLAGVYADAPFV